MISQAVNNEIVGQDTVREQAFPTVGMARENFVQIMWRSRWIVLATMVASLAAAFIYINNIVPLYTSTSRIYVEPSGPKILTEAEGVMTQSKNYLYTQAELLKSTPILSAALEHTGTKRLKVFEKIDNPIVYLKEKGLDISVGKKDDIISISSDSPDPNEAALLVNTVVDSYIKYHASRKRSTTGEILRVLQKEKRQRDKELAQKLKAMMEFKSNNIALAFDHKNSNIILDELDRLSAEMTQAQLQTIEAKSVFEMIKSMMSTPAGLKQFVEIERAKQVHPLTVDERTRLKMEFEQIQGQLADLDRQATPNHPWVQTLRQKVARTQKQIADLDAEFAQAQLVIAEREYESAREKEKQIAGYYQEHRQKAVELNKLVAGYRILESDWEQTRKLCDIVDDRIKEINVTEDVGCLYISILEVAHPADEPSGPHKGRYVVFASLFGLMLAVGLVVLRDYMDQQFYSAEGISAVLGMPFLGMVPSMFWEQSGAARCWKFYLDSNSSWAKAYSTIRRAILFGEPGAMAKTILVTSPTTTDGKSTLVSNLAIAMAQAGQRTLILDADFGNSTQQKIFEVNHHDVGLSTTLAGITTSGAAIQSTGVKGLELLPSGPDIPNPSEMLNSDRFVQLLEILSDRYDRVIIDSPAVVPITDARTLASICDMTILVVRVDKATRKKSRQARDGLLSAGARILGVVVNDVPKKGCHGYYDAYGQNNGRHSPIGHMKKNIKTYVNDVSRPELAAAIAGDKDLS
jgi:capsular exopolysaccharide synthesis family protein